MKGKEMHLNERYIEQMRNMNRIMLQDKKNGHTWKYSNKSKKKANSFEKARSTGKYYANCVDGPHWALKTCGVPGSALSWFGAKGGKISWCAKTAEKEAKKYFEFIKIGNKTVSQLIKKGELLEGDMLTYVSMNHTNAYLGSQSFDSGHAFAKGSGENAIFKKWIGHVVCKGQKVGYIVRVKDRKQYRVQCGAFSDMGFLLDAERQLQSAGFKTERVYEDGLIKLQAGLFTYPKYADTLMKKIHSAKLPAIIKEV